MSSSNTLLIPELSAVGASEISYSFGMAGMAETFSWIPIQGNVKPFFAKAVYPIKDPPSILTILQGSKTVASLTEPTALTDEQVLVDSVEIFARRSRNESNTGLIWIGSNSTLPSRPLSPNGSVSFTAPPNTKINLESFFISSEVIGDGVIYTAFTTSTPSQ